MNIKKTFMTFSSLQDNFRNFWIYRFIVCMTKVHAPNIYKELIVIV